MQEYGPRLAWVVGNSVVHIVEDLGDLAELYIGFDHGTGLRKVWLMNEVSVATVTVMQTIGAKAVQGQIEVVAEILVATTIVFWVVPG